jgi:putative membrane-bound dehydrogenase-like protein
MNTFAIRVLRLGICGLAVVSALGGEPPRTGPETEKRFPPLKVPPGLVATLFACDPLIEYPSAITAGPRPGSILVAVDYLTGLGTAIVRRDEIRRVEDTNGDGYADRATVYAGGFNSIQGLAYLDGTAFVMHAPALTALRDEDGDGVAEVRRDLLTGLGLPPESNPVRLHCANGVVAGHDGWLYLALGDHGCDVMRPEGDRLVLRGGGILRCRTDGRDLHVFATGLRNIYDVALDEDLNVFVRDNENDGGDYKVRVYHSFFGADHGYPHLYAERPEEALRPLADLGLGSSAGGLFYLETALPREYRGNLFFCEWGRAVMRYRPEPSGSSFTPLKELEFAAGAAADPYGFKPTDLAVQRDGSILVADWADGQQPKRGRGRIYRIGPPGGAAAWVATRAGPPADGLSGWIARLDAESSSERIEAQAALERLGPEARAALRGALARRELGVRGRGHAIWALARSGGAAAVEDLIDLARTDREPRIRAQALRAVADLIDPVLVDHRLDAGPSEAELVPRLAPLARDRDPRVVREAVIAVGRLGRPRAPSWLHRILKDPDPALAHAAMQAMRRSRNWPEILALLDQPDAAPARVIAVRALAERAEPVVVDGLIDRVRREPVPARRSVYADLLSRVYKKPGPEPYWGYRPAPRPANTVAWERTDAIAAVLGRLLADPDRAVRMAVLRRMHRERVPTPLASLGALLRTERDPEHVAVILASLREHPVDRSAELLRHLVTDRTGSVANRLTALRILAGAAVDAADPHWPRLLAALEDGPVLAEALRTAGRRRRLGDGDASLLVTKLGSPDPTVRAAAVEAVAALRAAGAGAAGPVRALLQDRDAGVRRAAVAAVGTLGIASAVEPLLKLAQGPDPELRRASLESLRQLGDPRALPLAVAGLPDRATEVAALRCLGELGGPDQAGVVADHARRHPTAEVLPLAVRLLTDWGRRPQLPVPRQHELARALAELQGASGDLLAWQVAGPLPAAAREPLIRQIGQSRQFPESRPGIAAAWQTRLATGTESPLRLDAGPDASPDGAWLAFTEMDLPEATAGEFQVTGSGWRIWLNGRLIHRGGGAAAPPAASAAIEATLARGPNRLLVEIAAGRANAFHLRFRRRSSRVEHERLMRAALTRSGDAQRGRRLLFDREKSQCLKCHRIGDQGERIGPELTGVGGRFSRIFLVESILEPSRTIAPSFETVAVALQDGRVLAGVRAAETDRTLTLADQQGQAHVLARSSIQEQKVQPQSTMPEGLEQRFTPEEFLDLIEFLASQK